MKPFEDKAPALRDFCIAMAYAQTGKNPMNGFCATCGAEIDELDFRDAISRREYKISGMCQKCQDDVFGT